MLIFLDIIDTETQKYKKFELDDQNFSRIYFNLKNQLILHNGTTIWTYSTHKNWACEEIPKDYRLIGVTKDGKRYLLSENYIYEWSDEDIPAKRILTCENDVI